MTRQPTPDILDNVLGGATPAPPAPTTVALTAIVNDGGTQMRAGMDAATITEYSEALAEADAWPFPPIVVFHDGEKYWLADGFHRVNAAHRIGKFSQIPADVRSGTRRDAVLHAAGANASHGLRRTNGDKRRAVDVLLRDEEWSQWSDGEIARKCAVSQPFVSAMRRELTQNGFESTARKGADGRTINTANIGATRSARLYIGDLKSIVSRWMGEFWQHAWPDNPSHTNGEFWRELTAWMHANVRDTWQEGDLKEAIKALHWASVVRPGVERHAPEEPVMPEPSRLQADPAPANLAVWELERTVREVFAEAYRNEEQPYALRDMRAGAKQRTGRFWTLCVRTINADNWRHVDLVQAINNVASQIEQRAATEAAPTLHQGAGVRPVAPLTVEELVEDLGDYLASFEAWEIDQAGKGAQNKALEMAHHCLSDFTYRQADLYRALQRLALQRGAPKPPAEPQVNGDRALPAWAQPVTVEQTAADVVEVMSGTPTPTASPSRHPQHDDLFELSECFSFAIRECNRWGNLTGEHTAIMEAQRGLRRLVERTQQIMADYETDTPQ